jgi:hypothetical protein
MDAKAPPTCRHVKLGIRQERRGHYCATGTLAFVLIGLGSGVKERSDSEAADLLAACDTRCGRRDSDHLIAIASSIPLPPANDFWPVDRVVSPGLPRTRLQSRRSFGEIAARLPQIWL